MKRKPMLFKRLSAVGNHTGKVTIGLAGINRGCGVTYTGMLLAGYFGSEKRMRTAFLECNNHTDFSRLQSVYEWDREDEVSFSLGKVTFYKQADCGRIPGILSGDYDCFILDFGTDCAAHMNEFIRCTYKIVVADGAVWNQGRMLSFLEAAENITGNKEWIFLIPLAGRKTVNRLANMAKRSIYRLPYEPDPTSISEETFKLFNFLFG